MHFTLSIGSVLWLIIGYLCGVWLSDFVFLDLALMNWSNGLTYVWLAFWLFLWPFGLIAHFLFWVLIIGVPIGAAVLCYRRICYGYW